MKKKINKILNDVLNEIQVPKQIEEEMTSELKKFLIKINKRINKFKIKVEPFVGGSFSKKTLIKKENYDIDLFLRFDKNYTEKEILKLTKKILRWTRKKKTLHGSRDYFQIKINENFKIEVVPVMKVSNPLESENITDLSYSHVKYITKKTKPEILNQIRLAKAFCQATNTYGAESYIHGFSGYGLELLIIHYKTLEKMLYELTKKTKEKIIIDIEKMYKNKNQILFELNGSKLISPIILIDPTFKERNVLASLNEETFNKFKTKAKEFLKNPKKEFFFPEKLNLDELKKQSLTNKKEFLLIKLKTNKPSGDVAGTKLLKFFNHLKFELDKFYEIKEYKFKYEKTKEGKGYFILNKKNEFIFTGPKIEDEKNVGKFKKEHATTYIKNNRIYAKEKINLSGKEFLKNWKKKNKNKIKEMYINNFEII